MNHNFLPVSYTIQNTFLLFMFCSTIKFFFFFWGISLCFVGFWACLLKTICIYPAGDCVLASDQQENGYSCSQNNNRNNYGYLREELRQYLHCICQNNNNNNSNLLRKQCSSPHKNTHISTVCLYSSTSVTTVKPCCRSVNWQCVSF